MAGSKLMTLLEGSFKSRAIGMYGKRLLYELEVFTRGHSTRKINGKWILLGSMLAPGGRYLTFQKVK